jgi:phospholipid/cholesterol/gamma-HCH transport system permease protein
MIGERGCISLLIALGNQGAYATRSPGPRSIQLMATVTSTRTGLVSVLGIGAYRALFSLGDLALFSGKTLGWMLRRRPAPHTLMPTFYSVGVRSMPVVAITGAFIGMVLAVQTVAQFQQLGLGTRVGSMINMSIIRELGPVLAATMLAGRVGSAMAAELATMRITEQIDALACLGANPLHYLVVPRFLAAVLLIPLLTVVADFMGVMGGALISTGVFRIETHYYWEHAQAFVGLWDIFVSLVKPMFFGAVIALLSCYRGFNSEPGAEGVGRAATQAFVISFVTILVLDFFLAMFFNNLHDRLWPSVGPKLM